MKHPKAPRSFLPLPLPPSPQRPAEPPYEEKLAVLDAYERQLREVLRLLGSASPYSEGIDALREAAEKALGSYRRCERPLPGLRRSA